MSEAKNQQPPKQQSKDNALFWAVSRNDAALIRQILKDGANVNACDEYGHTPLFMAAHRGNLDIVTILLEHGAKVDILTKLNESALHAAAENGHLEIVKKLLNAGINANQKDNAGNKAEFYANDVIRAHIAKAAKPEAQALPEQKEERKEEKKEERKRRLPDPQNQKQRPPEPQEQKPNPALLGLAAEKGDVKAVRALLEQGLNVDAVDEVGQTALHWAAVRGHERVITTLLDHKANIDASNDFGVTPLHLAVSSQKTRAVIMLLTRGANARAQESLKGRTPLHQAVALERYTLSKESAESVDVQTARTIIRYLLEADLDSHWIKDHNGRIALQYSSRELAIHLARAETLLQATAIQEKFNEALDKTAARVGRALSGQKERKERKQALPEPRDQAQEERATALIQAARDGDERAVRSLLKPEAPEVDINATDSSRRTPLHWAVMGGREEIVTLLLHDGAHVNARDRFLNSSLHFAAMRGDTEMVMKLLQRGANIDAQNHLGRTALHEAAGFGRLGTVKCLLLAGANSKLQDGMGRTAAALCTDHYEISRYITTFPQRAHALAKLRAFLAAPEVRGVVAFPNIPRQLVMDYLDGDIDFDPRSFVAQILARLPANVRALLPDSLEENILWLFPSLEVAPDLGRAVAILHEQLLLLQYISVLYLSDEVGLGAILSIYTGIMLNSIIDQIPAALVATQPKPIADAKNSQQPLESKKSDAQEEINDNAQAAAEPAADVPAPAPAPAPAPTPTLPTPASASAFFGVSSARSALAAVAAPIAAPESESDSDSDEENAGRASPCGGCVLS